MNPESLCYTSFQSENTKVQILEKDKTISQFYCLPFRNIWFPQFRLNLTHPHTHTHTHTHTHYHTPVYHADTPLSQFASIAAQLMIPFTIHF